MLLFILPPTTPLPHFPTTPLPHFPTPPLPNSLNLNQRTIDGG
ncbi:hypothetical protein [Microcystis sp. M53602_WE12]|nr:hypothetical protein [Microcystis sp. M53602_WE12]